MIPRKLSDAMKFVDDLAANIYVAGEEGNEKFRHEQRVSNSETVFYIGKWDETGRIPILHARAIVTFIPELGHCSIALSPSVDTTSTVKRLFFEQEYCFDRFRQDANGSIKQIEFEREQQWRMN